VSHRAPITFAAVAEQLAEQGWRPFPGWQASKRPAMRGWPGLNRSEWDGADLAAAVADYRPADDFCCCLAVQSEIVAVDLDIVDQEHAAAADRLANDILGRTPLVRIGLAPKQIRIYRSGDPIRSRKLHPLEIFSGSGQFIAYGWHEKAERPYTWPHSTRYRLPVLHALRAAAIEGRLISYGVDLPNVFRQAAVYADRILKGANPADLPISLPTKFELVINLTTAKTLGIDVPMSLMVRADEMLD
jgi:hypothetical protein